jgi:hypothetical protein
MSYSARGKNMREFSTRFERKPQQIYTGNSMDFIKEFTDSKRIHFMSRDGVASSRKTGRGEPTSKFVLALHDCFADHIPFSLSPEVIMSIISQEVAEYVKANSTDASIASLFTRTPGVKQEIVVEVNDFIYGSLENDWAMGIAKFQTELSKKVPSEILSKMTPKFSEGTLETEVSQLVSFMDAASKYYSYTMMTVCGIPSFRIEGTSDDWNSILRSVDYLDSVLPGLNLYFRNLRPVLVEILNTVDGNKVDQDFWNSIYKSHGGSGGPYSSGWFNLLFAHIYGKDWQTGQMNILKKDVHYQESRMNHMKLNNYPSSLSLVDFTWNYLGTKIPMKFVSGVTSVDYTEDGFLKPKLGIVVLERNPE